MVIQQSQLALALKVYIKMGLACIAYILCIILEKKRVFIYSKMSN